MRKSTQSLLGTLTILISLHSAALALSPLPAQDLFDGYGLDKIELPHFKPVITFVPTTIPAPTTLSAAVLVTIEISLMPFCELDRVPRHILKNLEILRVRHGFIQDRSVSPQPRTSEGGYMILPFPAQPKPMIYSVQGFLLSQKLEALAKEHAVVKVTPHAKSFVDPVQARLLAFIDNHGGKIAAVSGVVSVGLGLDCGVKGQHVHVKPHAPAVVIVLSDKGQRQRATRELLAKVPGLVKVSHRFEVLEVPKEPRFQTY